MCVPIGLSYVRATYHLLPSCKQKWGNSLRQLPSCSVIISFSCQLDSNLESLGKRESRLRNCLHRTDLWECLWGVSLIANWCRRTHSTGGSAIHGKLGLTYIRKLSVSWEQISGFLLQAPALTSCLGLSPWPIIYPVRWNKALPLGIVLVVFYYSSINNWGHIKVSQSV